ncbi:hypothetical protein BRM3_08220 [Brachybacterium huguangmaarense]|uniref:Phage head morphogenesis domain-containing protein n=1 Tax=Brachybacterium huguangmaarense TaxID=1652028 RepID=A0ABY6FYX0_9MICO|nr:hypothetical protein [Brachybacterium huguangmaarense]UYG15634.1 hypothetical protein BRM3_08220 [Brachybacterium huguangmaarense]
MTTFTDLLAHLGSRAERQATTIASKYVSGQIDLEIAIDGLEVVVRTSNARGLNLGEAACRELLISLGDDTSVVTGEAYSHVHDAERIQKATRTALAEQGSAVMAAGRLARSEAIEAAQSAFSRTMQTSRRVKGWKRGMEPDACELCTWWWREGRVWPKGYSLQTHKGCTCRQVPVMIAADDMRTPDERSWEASEARKTRLDH